MPEPEPAPWWATDRSWRDPEAFAALVDVVRDAYPPDVIVAAAEANRVEHAARSAHVPARTSPVAAKHAAGLAAARAALRAGGSVSGPISVPPGAGDVAAAAAPVDARRLGEGDDDPDSF